MEIRILRSWNVSTLICKINRFFLKHVLIHENREKYNGNVVHYPKSISPYELQREIIHASAKIYSFKRLLANLFRYKWVNKILFLGEFFWQRSFRKELADELPFLKSQGLQSTEKALAIFEGKDMV